MKFLLRYSAAIPLLLAVPLRSIDLTLQSSVIVETFVFASFFDLLTTDELDVPVITVIVLNNSFVGQNSPDSGSNKSGQNIILVLPEYITRFSEIVELIFWNPDLIIRLRFFFAVGNNNYRTSVKSSGMKLL